MTRVDRRDALKALAAVPLAATITWTPGQEERAASFIHSLDANAQKGPVFFNAQEWRTIRVLVDDIIPKDGKSGSATDAKVPEFMDFILNDGGPNPRTAMRSGLAWLDQESRKRFTKGYADVAPDERNRILDDIAWPPPHPRFKQEFRQNATWFNSVRDLTASGFFSSRTGLKDLGYTGNVAVAKWTGAPDAVLKKLGVSYEAWDKKYGSVK